MRIVAILYVILLTSCAVQKQWTATGGSRGDGTVKLSYEYSPFVIPKISAYDGVPLAAARCRAWGYSHAEPFGGVSRTCTVPSAFGGCDLWMVTAEYQCTTASQMSAPIQPITTALLLPAFFALTGMRVRIDLLTDTHAWVSCAGIILVATLGKVVGAGLPLCLGLILLYPVALLPVGFYLPAERKKLRSLVVRA